MLAILMILNGGFEEAVEKLRAARAASDRVRDAVIESVDGTDVVRDATAAVDAAREALDKAVADGDVGEETAAEIRRQLDTLDHEIARSRDQIEANLARLKPELPDPAGVDRQPLPPEALAPTSLTMDELRAFRAEIAAAIERVTPLSYDAAATLDKRFAEAGIERARGYASSWGGFLFTATHGTVNRHQAWLHEIDQVTLRLEQDGTLDAGYSDRLRREMARWRAEAGFVEEMCAELMRAEVLNGLALEQVLAAKAERWAYRISPEECDRLCKEPNRQIELSDEQYGRAAAAVRDPNLLAAPIRYDVWMTFPKPESPGVAPVRTERDEFRDEAVKMAGRLRERLDGHEWDPTRIYDSATTFDSSYFGADLFTMYDFDGRPMIGGEVNYYFQGMFWSRMGVHPQVMFRIIDAWNVMTGRPVGNRNQYAAALRGSKDMDSAMAHPEGPEAYFASDAYEPPMIEKTGDNPERVVPGNADRAFWP